MQFMPVYAPVVINVQHRIQAFQYANHDHQSSNAVLFLDLLDPLFSPSLDVSSTDTTTAQAHLEQPCDNGRRTRNPHTGEHGRPNLGTNVDIVVLLEDVAHDDEHDGRDDASGCDAECVDEGEDAEDEGRPARADGQRQKKHEYEGEAGPCQEEPKHDM